MRESLLGWLVIAALAASDASCSDPSSSESADALVAGTADGGTTRPAGTPPKDVSAELEVVRARSKVPALTAAAFKDGQLLSIGSAGVRKLGDPTKVTNDDKWHLGSCTKAMTATLVGTFVAENKVSFTATLPQLLPGLTIHPGFANVTMEMLLQHRAGLATQEPEALGNDLSDAVQRGEATPVTRARFMAALLGAAPQRTVGNFEYANSGYMVAGAILERMTQKSWEDLMKERIFGPLGMASCGFGPQATPPANVDQPWPHWDDNGRLTPLAPDVNADNPLSLGPAGTVHCSLVDWGKFLAQHVAGETGRSTLLPAEIFKRLHTKGVGPGEAYADGWQLDQRDWAGGLTLSHAGSNTMNYAVAWLAPAKGLVFIAASNAGTDGADQATDAAISPFVTRYAQ